MKNTVLIVLMPIMITTPCFAQCPPDSFPCSGFPEWCCYNEVYCEDPTPPDCFTIAGTTTTSVAETTTVNPDCSLDEWDCGDGTCCPLWASCCQGDCCERGTEICDNGVCRRVCVFFRNYGGDSVEVELLRQFRDEVLSKTPEGRTIIALYYQWSPILVRVMEADEEFKQEVKDTVDEILPLINGGME